MCCSSPRCLKNTQICPSARRSLELDFIPQTSLHRNLHKDLSPKASTVQSKWKLKPADHQQHRVSTVWVLEMHENHTKNQWRIILTDYVLYCLICDFENPRFILEKILHSQCATVWCCLWSGGVIIVAFENVGRATVTMKGMRSPSPSICGSDLLPSGTYSLCSLHSLPIGPEVFRMARHNTW